MIEIICIKNNKKFVPKRVNSIFDESGILVAVTFMINAKTFRKNHQGKNVWDIFFIVAKDKYTIYLNQEKHQFNIGKRDGIEIGFSILEKKDDLLGVEFLEKKKIDFENVSTEEALKDVEIVQLLKGFLPYIRGMYEDLKEGFNIHGEIFDLSGFLSVIENSEIDGRTY